MTFTDQAPTLHSLQEVAERFGVNERTVRRWIGSGALQAYKLGHQWRISQTDIDTFLQRCRR